MANPSSRKGTRYERELGEVLETDYDFAAMRTPASGSATGRDLPDLLAMRPAMRIGAMGSYTQPMVNHAEIYAIEIKYSGEGTARLDHDEVSALCRYALTAGAKPLIAIRPNFRDSRYDRWSLFEPRELTWSENSRGITHGIMPGDSLDEVFQ